MSVLLDPRQFIVDDAAKPFFHDRRIELNPVAPELPPFFPATPEFLIFDYVVEKEQVLLVKAIVPYAQVRSAAGVGPLVFIPASQGNTQFSFTPYIDDGALALLDWQYDANNTAATATNKGGAGGKGFATGLSVEPKQDAERAWYNPMTTWAMVPPDHHFRVTFKIVPGNDPTNFVIAGAPPAQRVDKAGCVVVGMQMSLQAYNQMVAEQREKMARKIEAHAILKDAWAWAKKKWGS